MKKSEWGLVIKDRRWQGGEQGRGREKQCGRDRSCLHAPAESNPFLKLINGNVLYCQGKLQPLQRRRERNKDRQQDT